MLFSWVKRNSEFKIIVPVTYSFTYPTLIMLKLKSDGELIDSSEREVVGSGIEFFTLNVKKKFTNRVGETLFKLRLHVLYPEEGYIEARFSYRNITSYLREFKVVIGILTANKPPQNLYPTNFILHIRWNKEKYTAVQIYNEALGSKSLENISSEDFLKWRYSLFNWLIFDSKGNIVMDNDKYKRLAFVAEIAFKRLCVWNVEYIKNIAERYQKCAFWAEVIESILIIQKLALNLILAMKGKALESCIFEGIEKSGKVIGLTLTTNEVMRYLREIDYANRLIKAVKSGYEVPENIIVWMAIFGLKDSASKLEETNQYLTDIKPGATIDYDDALAFFDKFKFSEIMGRSSMRLLAVRFSDKWLSFKQGIMELIPLSSAPLIYEKLRKLLGIKDLFDYFNFMINEKKYFELWEKILTEKALELRDIYLSSTSNVIVVKLSEPEGQHKLYLHIYDFEGRHIGLESHTKSIEVEIPGTYYFDLGRNIIVILPRNIKIQRMIIDADYAHSSFESYNITILTVKNQQISGIKVCTGTIKLGQKQEFTVDISPEGRVEVRKRRIGDVNYDGIVDYRDLAILIANYGKIVKGPEEIKIDINYDKVIDYKDLALLIANYGKD